MTELTDRDPPSSPTSRPGRLPGPLPIGHWADVPLAIGWSLPAAVAAVFLAGWWLRSRPGNADLPALAAILAVAIVAGACWQGILRLFTIRLLGGHPRELTLRAFGAWGRTAMLGAWRRALAGLLPPLGSFVLAVWLAAMPPRGEGWAGIAMVPLELTGRFSAVAVVTAGVWILFLQALVQCLPLPGCHGREVIAGLIEWSGRGQPLDVRRRWARRVIGLIAIGLLATGFASMLVAAAAERVPLWPFLGLLAAACWGTRGLNEFSLEAAGGTAFAANPPAAPAADSPAGDESGQEPPPPPPGLRKRWRSWRRQRETLRRLRAAHQQERQEAVDAERLDAILGRLHAEGMEALSSDEKAVLRRVSKRLQRNDPDKSAPG